MPWFLRPKSGRENGTGCFPMPWRPRLLNVDSKPTLAGVPLLWEHLRQVTDNPTKLVLGKGLHRLRSEIALGAKPCFARVASLGTSTMANMSYDPVVR